MSTLPETTDTSIVAQWDSGEWIAPIKFDTTDFAKPIDAPAASDVAVVARGAFGSPRGCGEGECARADDDVGPMHLPRGKGSELWFVE